MYGFEFLVGPYAVAHLRLSQQITGVDGELPGGRLQVYLADTLESPHTTPPGALDLTHRRLVEERERARVVNSPLTKSGGSDSLVVGPWRRAATWRWDGSGVGRASCS